MSITPLETNPKCSTCGAELRAIKVRVKADPETLTPVERESGIPQYVEVDDVSDCPRCTGSY